MVIVLDEHKFVAHELQLFFGSSQLVLVLDVDKIVLYFKRRSTSEV